MTSQNGHLSPIYRSCIKLMHYAFAASKNIVILIICVGPAKIWFAVTSTCPSFQIWLCLHIFFINFHVYEPLDIYTRLFALFMSRFVSLIFTLIFYNALELWIKKKFLNMWTWYFNYHTPKMVETRKMRSKMEINCNCMIFTCRLGLEIARSNLFQIKHTGSKIKVYYMNWAWPVSLSI